MDDAKCYQVAIHFALAMLGWAAGFGSAWALYRIQYRDLCRDRERLRRLAILDPLRTALFDLERQLRGCPGLTPEVATGLARVEAALDRVRSDATFELPPGFPWPKLQALCHALSKCCSQIQTDQSMSKLHSHTAELLDFVERLGHP